MIIKTPEQAQQDPKYYAALKELLFQLADDDFILAFRGSEWLGLAPHIEEDVAFSSISQNMMGHAAMYFQLLEDLGAGNADALAHDRSPQNRRNAVGLELVNGPGTYLEHPQYDWAFTVVRHYFYESYKTIKLNSLKTSSYQPLAHAAAKMKIEQYYHLMHWRTWFQQLLNAGGEARVRMLKAVERVWADFGGVLTLGRSGSEFAQHQLIAGEEELKKQFFNELSPVCIAVELTMTAKPSMVNGNGRMGEHTNDLEQAILTLSEVYRSEPNVIW